MDARQLAYLQAMGLEAFDLRGAPDTAPVVASPASVVAPPAPAVPVAASPAGPAGALSLDWGPLAASVAGCRRCALCTTRTRTVFGAGKRDARWMVIGEAPGADEDLQGEPFVGRAGELLTAMLKACGLRREDVFIANVLKCRPPGNRDPEPAEVAECLPYLHNQIELVNPGLILCLGRIAAQTLLGTEAPLGKLRGQVHHLGAGRRPVVVSYHPAYLLRAPAEKRKAWEDLQFAMAQVAPAPDLLSGST